MRDSGYNRSENDWYIEPSWTVSALVQAERKIGKLFHGELLDPCCGGGNIPKTLASLGHPCKGSDLIDRGFGETLHYEDSLKINKPNTVVSNPPYYLAEDFVRNSLLHTNDRVCVLLRLAFLEGQKRKSLFENTPLARVWVSRKRVSMPPGGSSIKAAGGTIAYAWFVWEHGHKTTPSLGWI